MKKEKMTLKRFAGFEYGKVGFAVESTCELYARAVSNAITDAAGYVSYVEEDSEVYELGVCIIFMVETSDIPDFKAAYKGAKKVCY